MDGDERRIGESPTPPVSPIADNDTFDTTIQPLSDDRSPSPLEAASTNEIDMSNEDEQASSVKPEQDHSPSTTIFRTSSSLWFVTIYSALALFAWITTCILIHRPIRNDRDVLGDPITYDNLTRSAYANNTRWFQVARVVQSIVSLLTIPLASAVCSKAAVTYIQRPRKGLGLTVRQTMVLADKGWSDPNLWWILARSPKRHGSTIVWLAIALITLGTTISPLQEIFLTRTVINVPSGYQYQLIKDISDILSDEFGAYENNLVPVLTRSMLASTSTTDDQTRLWSRDPACKPGQTSYDHCRAGEQSTLANIAAYNDPFLAELPFNFSTGVHFMHAPRFNSSATIEKLDPSEFPKSCETIPDAFFAEYTSKVPDRSLPSNMWPPYWKITTCMPANQTESPWQNTRCRQDFSEDLFVNVSFHDPLSVPATDMTYRIKLDTTAGYFELPNLANDQKVGPLSISDPIRRDRSCDPPPKPYSIIHQDRQSNPEIDLHASFESSLPLGLVKNKGPLLSMALALFGDGSYLATRLAHPEAYVYPARFNTPEWLESVECVDLMPFASLLQEAYQESPSSEYYADYNTVCLNRVLSAHDLLHQLADYVQSFIPSQSGGIRQFTNAINAAAFLANEQWLLSNPVGGDPSLEVKFDPGLVMSKPVMSKAAIVVVSSLLGVFLFTCFVLAVYAQWYPHWTNQLDSFAMMRIGAVLADKLPFHVAHDTEKISLLDETPGWVGDGTPDEKVGQLQLGAQAGLRQRDPKGRVRVYRCYDGYEKDPFSGSLRQNP